MNTPFPAVKILTFQLEIVVTGKVFELELSDTIQMKDFLKLFKMLMDFFRFCLLLTSQASQSDVQIFLGGHGLLAFNFWPCIRPLLQDF